MEARVSWKGPEEMGTVSQARRMSAGVKMKTIATPTRSSARVAQEAASEEPVGRRGR